MRYALVLILTGLCCGTAWAQDASPANPTPPALTEVYQCTAVTPEAARLACYDSAVSRLHQAETAGDFVGVDHQQADSLQRESFGFSMPALSRLFAGNGAHHFETADTAQMQVERINGAGNGRYRFVMSNGQSWVQVEGRGAGNVRPGDTVTVHRGVFGTFFLTPPRGGEGVRVRRES